MEAALGLAMVTGLVIAIFVVIPVLLAPAVLLTAWARRPRDERPLSASLLPEIEGVEEIVPAQPEEVVETPGLIEKPEPREVQSEDLEVHREDVVRAA